MYYDEQTGHLITLESDRFRLNICERVIPTTESERLEKIKATCEAYLARLGSRSYVHLDAEDRQRQQRTDLASAEWAVGVQNVIDAAMLMSGATENCGFRQ